MTTQIFVGNLSYQASEYDIRSAFERHGKVTSVRMMSDQMTGKSRGFAFVSMPQFEDAEEAIKRLNGSSLNGRTLVVNEARDRDEKPEQRQQPSNSLSPLHFV